MAITRKSIRTLIFLFALQLCSGIFNIALPEESLFGASSVSTCFLLLLSVAFFLYVSWVTVKGTTRKNLLWCGALFAMFFLLRGLRYVAFVEMDQIMRYLWYLYYLPMLFIPFFSFRAAVSVGRGNEKKEPKYLWALSFISLLLFILVYTNDFHQWAFVLNPGFRQYWIDEYTYGPLYYIVYSWVALLLLASLGIMFNKCRIAACRRLLWVPLITSVFGLIWLTMIALGKIPSINGHLIIEFPEAFCFTVGAGWVCCIQIGLLPANKDYVNLFTISSVHAIISDKSGNTVYSSKKLADEENMQDIQTHKRLIQGGSVSWQTDISKIRQMNEELDSIHQELREETELIRLENQLKEKNTMLEAKNALYDMIAVRLLPQSEKIRALSSEFRQDSEGEKSNLHRICLHGCYIKRMSNLMLLEAQQEMVHEMEFALAVSESLNYIKKFGIHTLLYSEEADQAYPSGILTSAYEIFESYIEETLDQLLGVQVTIRNHTCKLILECRKETELQIIGNSTIEHDEETCFITIPFDEKTCSVPNTYEEGRVLL